MRLAKQHIDLGLFTNNTDALLAFWRDEAGLAQDEILPMGGGVRQHRYDMNGSVLKVNSVRDPMTATSRSGYRRLTIARDRLNTPCELVDPDRNAVRIVPRGTEGVQGIAVDMGVRDEATFHRFYGVVMQFENAGENAYRCGDSLLRFAQTTDAAEVGPMTGHGYRYLTVQVWDVDAEHAAIIARGGREGRAPITLGATARISFVRDPDGNWIEISQRASLTGALPAG